MKNKIFNFLMELGVPCEVLGFDYIQTAVSLLVEDYQKYRGLTKELYPKVAEIHGTTPTRAERAIRYAKEKTVFDCNNSKARDYFGYPVSITNGRFLMRIAKRILENTETSQ